MRQTAWADSLKINDREVIIRMIVKMRRLG